MYGAERVNLYSKGEEVKEGVSYYVVWKMAPLQFLSL